MTTAPVVIPRPDPLTVAVPVWGAVVGAMGAVLSFLSPADVSAAIPRWGVLGFFIGLTLASGATLATMWAHNGKGIRRNIRAWTSLGSLCLTYSGWALQAFGLRAYFVVSLLSMICVASFVQARRLNAALSSRTEE